MFWLLYIYNDAVSIEALYFSHYLTFVIILELCWHVR